jgi:Rrf2 family nitric oxide-sensitive transcriptional repressor
MQLLRYTDYALRALIYLGAHPEETVSSATIAQAYGISEDHVAKATKALTRAGLLRATRGPGGGVALAVPPSKIRIGEVVRAFEAGRGVVACLGDQAPACRIAPACRLKGAMHRAQEAFFAELDRHTLADLVAEAPPLVRLLRKRPAERVAT